MRPVLLAASAAIAALLAWPGGAVAGWSAPQTTSVAQYTTTSMAVNARGETVVAWARSTNPGHEFGTAVYLTARTAGGRLRTRRIWSSRSAATGGIAAAVDSKGEVTVAWIVNTRSNDGGRSGPGKIYAAYGPLTGHWKQRRVLGRAITKPRLAVAPHGRVLLLWIAGNAESRNLVVAWRARGHSFRDRKALTRPNVVSTPSDSTGAVPAFDAAGAAYVAGECDAVVLRAGPNSHRLRTILDRGPALSATLSLSGKGRGVAGWVGGRCTSDISVGNAPGPVFATILDGGRFGPVRTLPTNNKAAFAHAVAIAGDGGSVSWGDVSGTLVTTVAADGSIATPATAPLGIVPFAKNGGGDRVLAGPGSGGQLVQFGVLVQPVGGGSPEHAPNSHGLLAVSQPEGRRVALAWNTSPTGAGGNLALSVWRP